jgi:hypothetical protein
MARLVPFGVGWAARMRRGGPGELARHGEARCPSRGRHVDAVGARRRPLVLFGEISTGVSGCPSTPLGVLVGWCGTAMLARAPLAVEKSAEAVPITSRDSVGGWEGPNAKPSVRTFVLVIVALTAATPFGGLDRKVRG